MASPLSSPSDSSLLAFSYDSGVDEFAYPHGYDQSQPQTPVSMSTAGPISHYAQQSLDPSSRLSSQPRRPAVGGEEEYELGAETEKGERGAEDIDPFSQSELVMMGGSSLLVVALICVSIMLTFGNYVL